MFGRRNPDSAPQPAPKPVEDSVDLNMLPNLPDISRVPKARGATDTLVEESPFERAWQPEQSDYQPHVPAPSPFVPTPPPSPAAFTNGAGAPTWSKSTVESVIGPDDFFDGNYRSERGVRLQGTVRGSIESRQYIYVEAGAKVEANLSAEEITVAGDFSGTIECRRRLEITGTGHVHGHVTTAMLVVQEGGLLDGELHMRREGANE